MGEAGRTLLMVIGRIPSVAAKPALILDSGGHFQEAGLKTGCILAVLSNQWLLERLRLPGSEGV